MAQKECLPDQSTNPLNKKMTMEGKRQKIKVDSDVFVAVPLLYTVFDFTHLLLLFLSNWFNL